MEAEARAQLRAVAPIPPQGKPGQNARVQPILFSLNGHLPPRMIDGVRKHPQLDLRGIEFMVGVTETTLIQRLDASPGRLSKN